ncbi:MAG: hypothetical protein AB1793_09765 [Candidatus Thermoplasmatota archaeon]
MAHEAGISGQVLEVDCAQITVSVAGFSYSTPPKCTVAYARYMESVYTCGPALPNFNCNPQGYQATIKNYLNGRCPDVTGLTDGMSWDSWDDVPPNLLAIIAAMSTCIDPQVETTFDWSASVTACPSQRNPPETPLRSGTGGDGHAYSQTTEDPRAQGWGLPRVHPFETDYERAMASGGGSSDPLLQKVEASFPPLSGVFLAVSLDVEHYPRESDIPEHVWTCRYDGSITSDETFDLAQTSVVQRNIATGIETWIRRERQLFDGVMFLYHTEGTPEGGAFLPEALQDGPVLGTEIRPNLFLLHWWLRNPFQISRFASHTYTSEKAGALVTLRKLDQSGGGSYVSREFVIDPDTVSYPRVLSAEIRGPVIGPSGEVQVRESTAFADFREVAPGAMRPFDIDHTVFYDGRRDGRRVRRHYRIEKARILSEDEIEAIPFGALEPGTIWTVWQ